MRSAPSCLSSRASATESSIVQPPSAQSVVDRRTNRGNSSGQAWRTARVTSRVNRTRLSNEPPY